MRLVDTHIETTNINQFNRINPAKVQGHWLAIIAPPMHLNAKDLQQQGIDVSSSLIIHNAKVTNKFQTLIKAAQTETISSVVTWDNGLTPQEICEVKSVMAANNKQCVFQTSKNLH